MSSWRGSLQPAHRGYQYQDIATAYELVLALVEGDTAKKAVAEAEAKQ